MVSQGFSRVCLRPRDIFRSSSLTLSIITSMTSPTDTTFEGCLMCLVHDISEMWTRPSTPGSSSTKAP